jgi:predicted nucleic acid-binding protein
LEEISSPDSPSIKVTKLFCSDYVVDEAVTTCYARTRSRRAAVELGGAIMQSKSIILLRVNGNQFSEAFQVFSERYQDVRLSFTDCTTYVLMQSNNITGIFSFDKDFDALGMNRIPK